MAHVLDNPIFNGLDTGNSSLASGNDQVKMFPKDVSPLAGLMRYDREHMDMLEKISPPESLFILFTPDEPDLSAKWKKRDRLDILQMVCDRPAEWPASDLLIPLGEEHVPQMLKLTKTTNPGPFLPGTVRLGNYCGIFDGQRLVAMAGHRLHPGPYVEISAVCTDPEYHGRGYAGLLMADQISGIRAASETPFLHVKADNEVAIRLYRKLGFTMRKKMYACVIQKLTI